MKQYAGQIAAAPALQAKLRIGLTGTERTATHIGGLEAARRYLLRDARIIRDDQHRASPM